MSKLKTKSINFNKETGEAEFIYQYKHYNITGTATCHEDDMDMCSERTGIKIAETRAFLKYLKIRREELRIKLDTLVSLLKNMQTSKDFDVNSKYYKKIRATINQIKEELYDCQEGIHTIPSLLKKEIEMKDEYYKKIRRLREEGVKQRFIDLTQDVKEN